MSVTNAAARFMVPRAMRAALTDLRGKVPGKTDYELSAEIDRQLRALADAMAGQPADASSRMITELITAALVTGYYQATLDQMRHV